MTPIEVGLLSIVVALGSVIGTSKVNGRNKLTKNDHETLCSARMTPLHEDITEIKKDVKELIKLNGGK